MSKKRFTPPYPHRIVRGEEHWNAKITAGDVRRIRRLAKKGTDMKRISDMFGIAADHARTIVRRKSWESVR